MGSRRIWERLKCGAPAWREIGQMRRQRRSFLQPVVLWMAGRSSTPFRPAPAAWSSDQHTSSGATPGPGRQGSPEGAGPMQVFDPCLGTPRAGDPQARRFPAGALRYAGAMDVARFRSVPLLGILRGVDDQDLETAVRACLGAGVPALEVALNGPGALRQLERLALLAAGQLSIGAGTVLSVDQAKEAVSRGATFIVSPALIPELVEFCRSRGLAVFPGALSPSEVARAHGAGATMVKVFPAGAFGPGYLRELRVRCGPVNLMACGGVNETTILPFCTSGADAVAVGASVFRREWLTHCRVDLIQAKLEALARAVRGGCRCPDMPAPAQA